jgi:hypothetical protein
MPDPRLYNPRMETPSALVIRRYRLLPEGLPAAEQYVRNRQLIPFLAIFAALVLVSTFLGYRHRSNLAAVIPHVVVAALYLTYIFFTAPRRTPKVLARCWSSYVLEIGPDYLLRQQAETPDVRLSFSDIKRIERRPGENARLIGAKSLHVIAIPEGIEHFSEIWQTVSVLAPVSDRGSTYYLTRHLMTAACAAGYLVMLWSTSPPIVFSLGAALVSVLLWRIAFLRRSPNVSHQAKRAVWTYLFVIFLVGLRVWSMASQVRRR